MQGLLFCLIFSLFKFSLSCDQKELASINISGDAYKVFIFAIDETFPGSFNKTLFFKVLEFNNIFQELPVITSFERNSITQNRKEKDRCDMPGGLRIIPSYWLSYVTKELSGTIYGCRQDKPLEVMKIFVNRSTKWDSKEDSICHNETTSPLKYLENIKNCFKDLNEHVEKCLHQKNSNEISQSVMTLGFAIAAFCIAIYFIRNLLQYFVHTFKDKNCIHIIPTIKLELV